MIETNQSLGYLWNVHAYMNSYIQFADRKSGVFIAVATTVIAYQSSRTSDNWAKLDWGFFYATIVFAALSFVCGLLVVTPRLFTANPFKNPIKAFSQTLGIQNFDQGEIYWGEVVKFGKHDEYYRSLASKGDEELTRTVARHVHTLASILVYKYWYLDTQVKLMLVSLIAFACLFFRSNL